jgi:hypothetical protein
VRNISVLDGGDRLASLHGDGLGLHAPRRGGQRRREHTSPPGDSGAQLVGVEFGAAQDLSAAVGVEQVALRPRRSVTGRPWTNV